MPNNTWIYLTLPNSPEIQSQLLQQGASLCLELLFKYRMLQNLSCHCIFSSTSYYWPLMTTQCAFPENTSLATETGNVGMWISRSLQHTQDGFPPVRRRWHPLAAHEPGPVEPAAVEQLLGVPRDPNVLAGHLALSCGPQEWPTGGSCSPGATWALVEKNPHSPVSRRVGMINISCHKALSSSKSWLS